MDNNIVQSVFDSLEADTHEINKTRTEYAALEAKIKEGRYSNQTLQKEIYPKRDELKRKVSDASARAIKKAHDMIATYRADAEALSDLDPSAITDDVKILQAGVTLTARDIQAIINRNPDNRTMIQIALRYAKEHNIDMKGTYYIGDQQEKETANNLDGIVDYYARWIEKENNLDMLNRFFNVG
jgi:hypothetical protein